MSIYTGFNTYVSKPTFHIHSSKLVQKTTGNSLSECLKVFHKYTDENKVFGFIANSHFVVPISGKYYIRLKSKQGSTLSLKSSAGYSAARNIPGSVKSYTDNDTQEVNTTVGEYILNSGEIYELELKYWCRGESEIEVHITHEGIGQGIDQSSFVSN